MQIEQMETVLSDFIRKRSKILNHPITQPIVLSKSNIGLRVGQYSVEIGVDLILEGIDLNVLVEKIIDLNWALFHKAKEEKRRLIEKEKGLAEAHILELQRLCTTEELTTYLRSFIRGALTTRGD